ncbi:MAG: hypothetical protein C7N36_21820 [Bacteroidetes bacterium]|nr:MAG: hypothetical protein C7N36_21820 [Bacteroidota bacterium]
MPESYLSFDLIGFPASALSPEKRSGKATAGVLVIVTTVNWQPADQAFLESILAAAQLTPLADKTLLLLVQPDDRLDLTSFCRHEAIHTVLLFGHPLPLLGIRAELPWYAFTRLGDLSLLRVHALSTIREEREKNQNEKAGALWKALKAKFL